MNVKEVAINETIVTLPTQNVLGYEIARLFSDTNCTEPNTKDYYLSGPYFEPHSKTMSLSVGQITKTALLTLEVKLKDFVEDVTYFDAGPNSYAILFDKKHNVWMHRNFPRPEIMSEQPLRVALENIENVDKNSVKKMIAEELLEGSYTFNTTSGRSVSFRGTLNCVIMNLTLILLHTETIQVETFGLRGSDRMHSIGRR